MGRQTQRSYLVRDRRYILILDIKKGAYAPSVFLTVG
ncbi:hypothetical protein YFHUAIHA_CDS0152 [Phage C48C1]|nr:hypothetical protein YFHUAIHA_CDS0152 [Phage C48C1]